MAGEADQLDNVVLLYLREIRGDLKTVRREVTEVKREVTQLRGSIASLRSDVARIEEDLASQFADRFQLEQRVDQIERRLELRDDS